MKLLIMLSSPVPRYLATFHVLTAASVFCDMTACRTVNTYRRFEKSQCLSKRLEPLIGHSATSEKTLILKHVSLDTA